MKTRTVFVAVVVAALSLPAYGQSRASSPATTSGCAGLVERSLGWWLSAEPTTAQREQLQKCISGMPLPATSNAQSDKPANWSSMTNQQQAFWLCRDDPGRITARCKMVPKETTPSRQSEPARLSQTPTAPRTGWSAIACQTEGQSLAMLSQQIDRGILQLQQLAGGSPSAPTRNSPPSYTCKDGLNNTVKCEPDYQGPLSGAGGMAQALQQTLDRKRADARFERLAAQLQSQQADFQTRSDLWRENCWETGVQ